MRSLGIATYSPVVLVLKVVEHELDIIQVDDALADLIRWVGGSVGRGVGESVGIMIRYGWCRHHCTWDADISRATLSDVSS